MGIHYDYKSTRGDKAMKKEAKRKARIDERRAKIGLGPIADHLMSRFSFEWRLEEQLQRTREFEFNQKAAADKRDN